MTAFARRSYDGGGATTTLSTNMGSADTTFVLTSATGWPGATPTANFTVVIDRSTPNEEKILCSGNAGTTVTVVTRGIDGTSATTHNASAFVSLCGIAQDFDEANQVSHLLGNLGEGSIIYGKGAATIPVELVAGTTGYQLTMGASDPQWSAPVGQVTSNYQQSFISSQVLITAATNTNITNVSLTAGTWLIHGQVIAAVQSGTANDYFTLWLGPTSASVTGAYACGNGGYVNGMGQVGLSISAVVVLATTTTVYLEGYGASNAWAANTATTPVATHTGSGITAVRIA